MNFIIVLTTLIHIHPYPMVENTQISQSTEITAHNLTKNSLDPTYMFVRSTHSVKKDALIGGMIHYMSIDFLII